MKRPTLRTLIPWLVPVLVVSAADLSATLIRQDHPATEAREAEQVKHVKVEFLEFVTSDVDATCATLAKIHGVTFSEPVPEFGNGRTAPLAGGGRISVRAPMHAAEDPVVRPYLLVDDIESATDTAAATGGQIAMASAQIPEQGTFSIYFQGGNQFGLWKN